MRRRLALVGTLLLASLSFVAARETIAAGADSAESPGPGAKVWLGIIFWVLLLFALLGWLLASVDEFVVKARRTIRKLQG